MLPDWLPNIHPLVIHFPVVLLPLSVLAHILCLASNQRSRWAMPIGILYSLGAVSALAAYFSGRRAADSVDVLPQANPVLSRHADLALWTLIIFTIVTVLYWLFQRFKVTGKYQALLTLVGLLGVGFLAVTADHGGQLVYRFGTGVSLPVDKITNAQSNDLSSALAENADGSWLWEPQKGDEQPFSVFRFIEGRSEDIQTGSMGAGEYALDQPVTFILDKAVADVQVDVKLNLSAFEGTLAILHHFQSLDQYDFLEVSSGQMTLGRFSAGKREEMESKKVQAGTGAAFRVVGSGRHFRGYLDEKLVVHGHAAPLAAGAVGLRIDGKGAVGISSINTIPIKNE